MHKKRRILRLFINFFRQFPKNMTQKNSLLRQHNDQEYLGSSTLTI